MQKFSKYLWAGVKLLALCLCGVLFVTVRYILETPQPLESALPGESHLYRWKRGHVFYKVSGDRAAPPLVLWHAPAIGGSGYEWHALVEQLARAYRVYVPDMLGFGLSDHPEGAYTASLYVEMCQDFLKDVVARPATLVASGLSGNYCVEVAARHPEFCTRLVLLSPLSLFEERKRSPWSTFFIQNTLSGFFFYALATSRIMLRNSIAKRLRLAPIYVPSDELEYTYAAAHQLGAQRAALAWLAGCLDLPVSQRLADLPAQAPVLILWGEYALQTLHHTAPLTNQTRVETLPGTGVRPHEEQPYRIAGLILGDQPGGQQTIEATEEVHTLVGPEQDQSRVGIVESSPAPAEPGAVAGSGVEAYCVRCRQKRTIRNAHKVTTKNGRRALEGQCPICGTRLFRFVAR
jgi:pimeloyl-ACP methyl ester carboxylesterase